MPSMMDGFDKDMIVVSIELLGEFCSQFNTLLPLEVTKKAI